MTNGGNSSLWDPRPRDLIELAEEALSKRVMGGPDCI